VVPLESTAWIARNVRYRDDPTADPLNRTLAHIPPSGVIVWAVIYGAGGAARHSGSTSVEQGASPAVRASTNAGGNYELTGYGSRRAYSAIIRIYFGSRPTKAMLTEARQALNELQLPAPR